MSPLGSEDRMRAQERAKLDIAQVQARLAASKAFMHKGMTNDAMRQMAVVCELAEAAFKALKELYDDDCLREQEMEKQR